MTRRASLASVPSKALAVVWAWFEEDAWAKVRAEYPAEEYRVTLINSTTDRIVIGQEVFRFRVLKRSLPHLDVLD